MEPFVHVSFQLLSVMKTVNLSDEQIEAIDSLFRQPHINTRLSPK